MRSIRIEVLHEQKRLWRPGQDLRGHFQHGVVRHGRPDLSAIYLFVEVNH